MRSIIHRTVRSNNGLYQPMAMIAMRTNHDTRMVCVCVVNSWRSLGTATTNTIANTKTNTNIINGTTTKAKESKEGIISNPIDLAP